MQQPLPEPPRSSTDGGWVLGGRYRVLDRLGSGGMAEVFSARDEVLDRLVAVKVFHAGQVARDDARGVERQQLEMAALARLNHPNLIALYDGSLATTDGAGRHAYIVMELIDGPSLAGRIAQGPLPEASVREIGIQLADGLAYVHAQGMVHRDVKPENILLGVDRSDDDSTVRARLSDFGIVRLLGSERLTSADLTLGTASYLAPEQARGSQVDPPADIYSLGLVLLEALTGQKMFDGPPLEAALARLSQRPQIPAGLPEPWPGLLYAMTQTDPRLRPSALEVARALRNEGSRALPLVPLAVPVAAGFADAPTGMMPVAAAGGPSGPLPPARPGGAPGDPAPRRRRRPAPAVIAAALSLLAILTTLGIFLATGNDSKSPAQPPPGDRTPAAQQTRSHSRTAEHTPGNQPVAARTTRGHGSPTHSATHPPTSSAPPSSSHAPTSSAPSPSHSTTAPATSTAPSTSAPPSTRSTTPSSSPTTRTSTTPTSAGPSPSTSAAASSRAAGPSTPA